MASGGARRGRRDNGLVAAAYAVAGDVDPRVGEHLLDVLAVRGIAAYLQPASDLHPVTRTTTLPSRPTDRLYVDREHLSTARGFLAELTSEGDGGEVATGATVAASSGETAATLEKGGRDLAGSDIDRAFADIVASFDAEIETGTWPEAEDVPPHQPTTHVDDEPEERPRLAHWTTSTVSPRTNPSLLDALDSLDALGTDDEEGYTPPPPPPIPRPSLATVLAVLGILVGFILFLSPDLLPIGTPAAMVLGFTGILAGVVTLIWRLRSGDEDDDRWDPDDGAVV